MKSKEAYINFSRDEYDYLSDILKMTGTELYDKYGLKRDETITYTADFGNGIEADIKIVVCEGEEKPYIDPVLFLMGCEEQTLDVADNLLEPFEFSYEDCKYIVKVRIV